MTAETEAVKGALEFVLGRTFVTDSMAENLLAALEEKGYRVIGPEPDPELQEPPC